MNIQIVGREEYEWSNGRKKNFAGLNWNDACEVLDSMNDEDSKNLDLQVGWITYGILSIIIV